MLVFKSIQRKRILCGLVTICMLLTALPFALANGFTYFEKEDQLSYAKGCLTEVFGYSYEEAEAFCFEQSEQDGIATVRYWHPDFPDWVYTSQFSLTDGQHLSSHTPFGSSYSGYPGENSVRYIISQVHEENLLANWDKAARERFSDIMEQDGFQPNADLEKGLLNATYTAQEALEDFFASCYGDADQWPEAVTEWYQWFLNTYQLESAQPTETAEGVTRYRVEDEHPRVLTEFYHATPPELVDVLKHPMLEGWTVISGTMLEFDVPSVPDSAIRSVGLIALGRDEDRLLCCIEKPEDDWNVFPVAKTALPSGCDPVITRSDPLSYPYGNRFTIAWENEQYQDVLMEVWLLTKENARFAILHACQFTDPATNIQYQLRESSGIIALTTIDPETASEGVQNLNNYAFPILLPYLDITTMLEAAKDPASVEAMVFPEEIIACNGVHLRKEATTHSKDQGTLLAGTLATKLGSEKGKDAPWYHVKIGLLEGYVSGVYVDEIPCYGSTSSLPVAITTEDSTVVENTGLFAPKVADIPAGTSMHVIMEAGNWYYVCLPQTQPAGMWMDPGGTYGYIKADQVLMGNSLLQLEWKLAEEK